MTVPLPDTPIQPVEPAYRHVLRLRAAIFWLPILVAAIAADRVLLADWRVAGLLPALVALVAISGIGVGPARVYRRLGYSIDDRLLRVVRGWLVHLDTIVPFVRVQHIDVLRGPLDKVFGTASLVVHTAGTHNSNVTLPGLAPERAAELRETIRGSIRSDAE